MKFKRIKKLFTLIELIVVIVVISVLAAIVIPNIASFKEEAKETAVISDSRNIQTAIDMYQLDNHGKLPTGAVQPEFGKPQSVDFSSLYPEHVRNLPEYKGLYYWIDDKGQLYYSNIDNPPDFKKGDSSLTWTANEEAKEYSILEVKTSNSSKSNGTTVELVDTVSGEKGFSIPANYNKENRYLIFATSHLNYQTPPVFEGYSGSIPFTDKENPSEPSEKPYVQPIYNRDWILSGSKLNITRDNFTQYNSRISDNGKFVVWQDYRALNYDIYGKDLSTGKEFVIANEATQEHTPIISPDGRYVYWQKYINSVNGYDIVGKDLVENRFFTVVTGIGNQINPQFSADGSIVVWQDNRNGNNDIYGKYLKEDKEFIVSDFSGSQTVPQITPDGRYVVWQDGRSGAAGIYGKDLKEDKEFLVSYNKGNSQYNPQISANGRYVVWEEYRVTGWDIVAKDLKENREFIVSDAIYDQRNPQINYDGSLIVWSDFRNKEGTYTVPKIYGKNMLTNKEVNISNAVKEQKYPHMTSDGKLITYTSTEYTVSGDIILKEISELTSQQ